MLSTKGKVQADMALDDFNFTMTRGFVPRPDALRILGNLINECETEEDRQISDDACNCLSCQLRRGEL